MTGPSMPGADVIFNSTWYPTWVGGMQPGQTWYTVGVLPSPDIPTPLIRPGCATQYLITGFEFGYCTDQASVDIELEFYQQFRCVDSPLQPLTYAVSLPGLPGTHTPGTQVCYTVTVDLRGGGGVAPFWMLAAGDGDWDPPFDTENTFGWGFRVTNHAGGQTGPLLSNVEGNWVGTRWATPWVDYGEMGMGIYSRGRLLILPQNWCVDLFPYATAMYLRLFSDACGALVGEPYCTGDGSDAACPCANTSPALNREGCRNSVNGRNGGRFEVTGAASLGADTVTLKVLRLPATTSVLFFQGTQREAGGLGTAFGDGLRCVSGSVMRLGTKSTLGGESSYPGPGDPPVSTRGGVVAPGLRTYQGWYRNNADFCTAATFNLTNGWELTWQP